MKRITGMGMVFIASVLTGCASIISDSNYPVTITSSPTEANFTITNSDGIKIHTGKTPATVMLESGDDYFSKARYIVTFKKEGYTKKTTTIKGKIDGWYIGNFFIGGPLGLLVIDPVTGAMWKLPRNISVFLDSNISSERETNVLKIVSIDTLSNEERKQLIQIK